jgi:hypothetical protein
MTAYLSPVFGAGAQLFNNQGIVLSGGKINTYQSGTTTPLTTWTDSTQLVANANPIILDSAGRLSNEIWLQASSTYKFILTDANNNVLGTWDNIAGLNDITSSVTVSEWQATNLTPTYISATSFSVPGNNTSIFPINRRVKIAVSAGTIYGYVVSSAFTTLTTVVIQPDSTSLDSGISSVNIGLLSSSNPSAPQQFFQMNAPVTIVAGTSTAIGAALSGNVIISGVTTIDSFDTVLPGILRFVTWSAATPITYNGTSMQLVGSVSRTNDPGDFSIFRSLGSGNWVEEVYQSFALFGQSDKRYDSSSFEITATAGSGILTITLVAPCKITTTVLGVPTSIAILANLTIAIPALASLGATTAVSSRLGVMYSAANACLMVVNMSGGNVVDETTYPPVTVISNTATSATVFYTASGTTTTAYKMLGFIDAVWTSGVGWATPSNVQSGSGASYALSGLGGFGFGQTYQTVTGSRAFGATYQNSTGRMIKAYVAAASGVAFVNIVVTIIQAGTTTTLTFPLQWTGSGSATSGTVSFEIPIGASYSLASSGTLSSWVEFR